jgi:hypothetical protein
MEDVDGEWERLAVDALLKAESRERRRAYGKRMRRIASVTGRNWSRARRAKELEEYGIRIERDARSVGIGRGDRVRNIHGRVEARANTKVATGEGDE